MKDPCDIESWLAGSSYSSLIVFDAKTGYLVIYENYQYSLNNRHAP